MKYKQIIEGTFLSRPNRFIAMVRVNGEVEKVHVKNTGRCKELLITGVTVYLQEHHNSKRKTKYSLIAVIKGGSLVNIDSQAPNKVLEEYIAAGHLIKDVSLLKRERTFGDSRFDLYAETGNDRYYIEAKGVTLEIDGGAYFPDAPTLRGLKHIYEMTEAAEQGFKGYIIFVIQMENINFFSPNDLTQPEFRQALKEARLKGVTIKAFNCRIDKDFLSINKEIPVLL